MGFKTKYKKTWDNNNNLNRGTIKSNHININKGNNFNSYYFSQHKRNKINNKSYTKGNNTKRINNVKTNINTNKKNNNKNKNNNNNNNSNNNNNNNNNNKNYNYKNNNNNNNKH